MKRTQGKVEVKNSGLIKDLWVYRHVFFMLIKQQLLIFYSRAIFGVAWMIINPLLYLVILLGVFFKIARITPASDIPFALIVFSGLIGWNLFSHFVLQCTNALRSFQPLMSKIYFPRIFALFCNILNLFIEFLVGFIILIILMLFLHYPLQWTLLYIPLIFIVAIFLFTGPAIITALLSYQYKDFQFLVPFMIQIGFYLSPIWFSPSMISDKVLIAIYNCNPAVGIISLIRACILGKMTPDYQYAIMFSTLSGVVLFFIGVFYWVKKRPFLSDIGV